MASPSPSVSSTTTATTALIYDTTRLSVADLFNAQAAQATHQRLVDVINHQSVKIEKLLRRVASLEATQRHAVAAQQHSLQQMDAAVVELERMQRFQLAAHHTQRSQQLALDRLATQAHREQLLLTKTVEKLDRLETNVTNTTMQLRRELAPMDLVLRLQDDQQMMHVRVATMETHVHGKLDKSELTRLDGVVATIHAFAPTASQLTTRVGQLEAHHAKSGPRLQKLRDKSSEMDDTIQTIQDTLLSKMDHREWVQFHTKEFPWALEALQEVSSSTQQTVNGLVHTGVALETKYRTLSSKLASITASFTKELDAHRTTFQEQVESKLSRGEMDDLTTQIRHELSCKAWRRDTQRVASVVSELTCTVEEMDKRVLLSTRFMEWFASRGDAYEKNLEIVESQLDRLALASAPRISSSRDPFTDQVRY